MASGSTYKENTMCHPPLRASALTLACLCSASVVCAQTDLFGVDKLASLSLAELMNIPVVTASRQLETRDQSPAHVLVFTREQIRERRYRNLADLLEDLPGVDFMRGTKSSAYNNFTFQGFSGPNKLLVLLDGVRVGNPAGGNFPVADNFALYAAKQVEVVFGPAAALYGADAVAGVVNIITDHAEAGQTGWVSAGVGAFGSREGSFMASMKGENGFSLTAGGHSQRSDRAPLNQYYPSDFPAKNATTLGGAVVVPAANREDYTGGVRSQSFFARLDTGQNWVFGAYRNVFRSLTSTGDKPETALYLDSAPWLTQTDTVYAKYRFNLSSDVSGELVADYSLQTVDPSSKYVNVYTNFTDGFEYTRAERLSVEQSLNWRLDSRHRIQSGVGLQKFKAIEGHTLPSPYDTSKAPTDQGMYYRNTNLPVSIHDAAYHNLSGYAQLQSDWDAEWSTTAGLRLDKHSAYGSSANPRMGVVWRAAAAHLFKASFAQAFRAPSPEESLSSFGSFDGSKTASGLYRGTGFRVPNFDLAPEKSKTISATWDWRLSHDANVQAHAYHSRIRNLIVTLPSTDVGAIPGALLISPESKGNAGEQRQTGLDVLGRYQFRVNRAWSGDLWASGSWINGRINEGDGVNWDLSFVAQQKYKLGATLRYLDAVSITPQLLWVGDTTNGRKKDKNTPPARLVTPGYTVANLHIGWHKLLDGRGTVWLDVYNLFDKRYYAAHGAGSRTFFNMPQQPRSWMLSFEYRF